MLLLFSRVYWGGKLKLPATAFTPLYLKSSFTFILHFISTHETPFNIPLINIDTLPVILFQTNLSGFIECLCR